MAFQRQSMEQIVDKMISWSQGVSSRILDYRVGSKIRTIYEAVALVIEEQYDKIYRALKQLIENNMYAMLGFDKIPATYTTGYVTFSRTTAADQPYYIAAGTMLLSNATETSAPLKFRTVVDAIIATGTTSVDVLVACTVAGIQGNVPANSLVTFIQKPSGVDSVTNNGDFTNGKDEETKEAQKARFQDFMEAQARGVLQAIEYGARQAQVIDSSTGVDVITEAVTAAKATEDLVNNKGVVTLYIWNGVSTASQTLINNVSQILAGYYDADGNPIYGYKAAGILVNIVSATVIYAKIKLQVTPDSTTTLDDLKDQINGAISRYFASLTFGQTAIQSALQANIKNIGGVADVKLYFSTDNGTTWTMNNITSASTQIVAVVLPVTYA